MKRALWCLIGVVMFWATAWGLSQGLGAWQRGVREERERRITQKMDADPILHEFPHLLARFREAIPLIRNDPDLLVSYETMLSLPDDPRSVWYREAAR